jgi:hypothetical protein
MCLPPTRAFRGVSHPTLQVNHDSWLTSKLTTHAAAILLRERFGFDVNVEERDSSVPSYEVYKEVATGAADFAFEVWPAGKEAQYNAWTGTGKTEAVPYKDFTCLSSRIYVSKRREPEFFFPELLATREGQTRLSRMSVSQGSSEAIANCAKRENFGHRCDTDGIFRTTSCKKAGPNCTAQILAYSPTYSTPDVAAIEASGAPVQVAFVGDDIYDMVWMSNTKGHGECW